MTCARDALHNALATLFEQFWRQLGLFPSPLGSLGDPFGAPWVPLGEQDLEKLDQRTQEQRLEGCLLCAKLPHIFLKKST